MQWDGKWESFPAFARDLEGSMLRLGAGYMFEDSVKLIYEKQGLGHIESDDFWDEHGVSLRQFKVDMKYLYGPLLYKI